METTHNKAPAGGATSPINGRFYEGGEFMPITGLACGAVKKAKRAAAIEGNVAEIRVAGSAGIFSAWLRLAGATRESIGHTAKTRDEVVGFATETIRLRSDAARAAGLAPHPTKLTVEEP
jgi:hypothetical protein